MLLAEWNILILVRSDIMKNVVLLNAGQQFEANVVVHFTWNVVIHKSYYDHSFGKVILIVHMILTF